MKKRISGTLIFLCIILLAGCNTSTETEAIPAISPTMLPTETVAPVFTSTAAITTENSSLTTVVPVISPTVVKFQQLPGFSLPEFNAHYSTGDLDLSEDGKYLAVVAKDRADEVKSVWVWNADDFIASLAGYKINADAWSVAFNSDGSQLAIGCAGKIILLDWQSGDLLTTIDVPNEVVMELTFGPNRTLAFSSFNDRVTVWDLAHNKVKYSVAGIAGFEPNHLAISPDGSHLITADYSEMHIWDYETGQSIETRKSPQGGVGFAPAFAFSKDGRYLAVGGCSKFNFESCVRGELSLWESDVLKRDLFRFPSRIQSLVFNMDGNYLAIVSAETQLELLDLRNGNFSQFPSLEKPVKIPPYDSFATYDMVFLLHRNELVVSTTDGIQRLEVSTLSRVPNLMFRLRLNFPYQITGGGDNVHFKTEPSVAEGTLIKKLHRGDGFNTIGGPVIADGFIWWKVKIEDGSEGWIAEVPGWYEFFP